MVCGEFGSPSLAPYNKGISFLNALCAILAVCFGIVGCVSYTNKFHAVTSVPWVVNSYEYDKTSTNTADDNTGYIASGIRSFAVYEMDDGMKVKLEYASVPGVADSLIPSDNTMTYADCMDSPYFAAIANLFPSYASQSDRCKTCDEAAVTVVTFCSFALIGAAVAFFGHVLRWTCDSPFAKDIAIIGGVGSFICGLVSYETFKKCARATKEWADSADATQQWGIGGKLVLGAFVVAAMVTTLTLITPVPPQDEKDEAKGEMVTKV